MESICLKIRDNIKKKITKRNLARKINVCRSTLDKFLTDVNNESVSKYRRAYSNYRFIFWQDIKIATKLVNSYYSKIFNRI